MFESTGERIQNKYQSIIALFWLYYLFSCINKISERMSRTQCEPHNLLKKVDTLIFANEKLLLLQTVLSPNTFKAN